MEMIKEYIRNIAVYIILTGFISIILPDNTYRKYISLIIGVIFVAMVIEPLKKGII